MAQTFQAAPDTVYPIAEAPTMYFIGVTTAQSSIRKVFPRWAEYLGLGNPDAVRLIGIDCKLHDDPGAYRTIVAHIKRDPHSLGALVTTHKIDLLAATRDLFDELGPHAQAMNEVSSISKWNGKLMGRAVDFENSDLALQAFLPADHWRNTGAHCLLLGAGGAAIAFSMALMDARQGENRPAKIIVANRSQPRLDAMLALHERLDSRVPVDYVLTQSPAESDALVAQLPEHSLVVNATGLGKDAPGSPVSDAAQFPQRGWVWDFNYRGELVFLAQARAQAEAKQLHIEDGWTYFLHGWTSVIAHVFHLDIPSSGPQFDELSRIAAESSRA
ncbi:MAG: hypothetical protein KDA42_04510 [Planctomycetales bacterium]|nr:hypothetical protein [Planctomycetales bacterium]